jgi:hypothetical protein
MHSNNINMMRYSENIPVNHSARRRKFQYNHSVRRRKGGHKDWQKFEQVIQTCKFKSARKKQNQSIDY